MGFAAAQSMWMPMHPGLGQGVGLGLKMNTAPPSPTAPAMVSRFPPSPLSSSSNSSSLLTAELEPSRPWTPDNDPVVQACNGLHKATTTSNTRRSNKTTRASTGGRHLSYQLPPWTSFQREVPKHTFLDSARSSSVVHLSAGTTFLYSARSSVVSDLRSSILTATADDSVVDLDLDLDIDPDLLYLLDFEGSSMTAAARADRHMAVSVRPQTAKDYQRYRSQWSSDTANMATTAAILARNNQNRLNEFYAPNVGRKRATPMASRKASSSRMVDGARRKTEAVVGATESRGASSSSLPAPNTPRKSYKAPSSASPAMMTREEFDSLPPAIQRKYFSALERLRFAQSSGHDLDDTTPDHSDDLVDGPPQSQKRRKTKLASDHLGDRLRNRSARRSRTLSVDSSFYANLPDKIQRRHLTPEEQSIAARHKRQSVILDPADEAIYKIGRRASRILTPDDLSSLSSLSLPPSPRRSSMDSPMMGVKRTPGLEKQVADSFMDSFRWMDEDDDLDLRLCLDDYNASQEDKPKPSKNRRPSFRRHLSISKIHLPRPSMSQASTRPGTKDATTPTTPALPLGSPLTSNPTHVRRRSRALSLMTPKPSISESLSTAGAIDPAAAHYQDPEARLKLRVYLASPQKFDEAIEFGFPSTDVLSNKPSKEINSPKKRQSRQGLADDADLLRTFLSDDKSSVYSEGDDASAPDPDSPKTPETLDKPSATPRPLRLNTEPAYMSKPSGEYAQAPASSREMTLRMTLTRPDLRAGEDQIYGWQRSVIAPARKSQSSPLRDDMSPTVTYIRDGGNSKDSIERQFAALDQWDHDKGVMKRIWNRVRRT